MNDLKSLCLGVICSAVFLLGLGASASFGQLKEPKVDKVKAPKTPLTKGLHNSFNFDVFLTNFGFGIGGHYTHTMGPYTELTFRTGITGIRDASEQTFQGLFSGQKIIPNKYKRALGFPFIFGAKRRIFEKKIADNFRPFIGIGAGPALGFTYSYVEDNNNNGFRDFQAVPIPGTNQSRLRPAEKINDFFSGWSDGENHWGISGELKIGATFGDFNSRTTVEFGYFFYYFKNGLQILEPFKAYGYDGNGRPIEKKNGKRKSFNESQSLFGTPQLKITFGGMW